MQDSERRALHLRKFSYKGLRFQRLWYTAACRHQAYAVFVSRDRDDRWRLTLAAKAITVYVALELTTECQDRIVKAADRIVASADPLAEGDRILAELPGITLAPDAPAIRENAHAA